MSAAKEAVRPRFVLSGGSETKKRPRLVLNDPTQAAVARTAAALPTAAALAQPQGSPTLAPPGRVPVPMSGPRSGGYHNRMVRVFCQQSCDPSSTGTRNPSVGRWRRGRITNYRGREDKGATREMVHVVYVRETPEANNVCGTAAEEWMALHANHDLRFELELCSESGEEALLEARAAPRFGGWPSDTAAAALSAGGTSDASKVSHATAALASEPIKVVAERKDSVEPVAVAAPGMRNFTSQDVQSTTGDAQNHGNDQYEGKRGLDSDSDLDLDFLTDELSAFVSEVAGHGLQVTQAAVRPASYPSMSTSAPGVGDEGSLGAGHATDLDVVDLT